MKTKIGIVVLAAACIGLLIALVATKSQADARRQADAAAILDFSNQVTTAAASLDDLRQVNLVLTNDLALNRQAMLSLSNDLAESSDALVNAKAALQGTQDQIINLNGRITDLEGQNKMLDDRVASLTNSLAALDTQIAGTQQKLSESETNNAFLTAELQRQVAEKAELERKFNDFDAVRAQVGKLRDELAVARRLQFIRSGVDSAQKGAGQLMQHNAPANTAVRPAHYDLNVEVGSDGSIHVIPPATNTPAAH